jgi:hypothetical protein
MPVRRVTAADSVTDKEREQGIMAKETIVESEAPGKPAKVKAPKPPKRESVIPTAARGAAEGPRPSSQQVGMQLEGHITKYQTLLNNAASVKSLSEDHKAAIDTARFHLSNALASHRNAIAAAKVGREDEPNPYKWSNTLDRNAVHGHLQDAAQHLASAHEAIVGSGVHTELAKHHLNGEVPSDSAIADLASKAYQLPRTGVEGVAGAKKPFKEIKFGRGTLPGHLIDDDLIDRAREVGGRQNVGVQKLEAGQGTLRDPNRRKKRNAAIEQINKVIVPKGAAPINKLPTGVGGQISGIDKDAPVNPKRRGRGVRIDTRFSSDANKIGRTPGFGETRTSGTIKGDITGPTKRSEGTGGPGVDNAGPSLRRLPAPEGKPRAADIPSGKPGRGAFAKRTDAGAKRALISSRKNAKDKK